MKNQELRIIFMGTPEFAVPSLELLIDNGYNVVGVVTAPDKPSGRGQQVRQSEVKICALQNGLTVFQPVNLKDPRFLTELISLRPDLQVVVAFRMLPKEVWKIPGLGTFNLHASLLPQYRGAAPINWAIINGEIETGVTTFFIDDKIDTGRVILRDPVRIAPDENAGELHDRLMMQGAVLVLKTVKAIQSRTLNPVDQAEYKLPALKPAPKLLKSDCQIDWNKNAAENYNFIRGLSPCPAAFTDIISPSGKLFSIKIFRSEVTGGMTSEKPGEINSDGKSFITIGCKDSDLKILELQLAGKKRMRTEDFLRGFHVGKGWKTG